VFIVDSIAEHRKDVNSLLNAIGRRLGDDASSKADLEDDDSLGPAKELENMRQLTFFWMSKFVEMGKGPAASDWQDMYALANQGVYAARAVGSGVSFGLPYIVPFNVSVCRCCLLVVVAP